VTLLDVPVGTTCTVVAVRLGWMGGSRLAALGFVPGTRVLVEENYGYAPITVTIKGARVAVGRGQAGRVMVEVQE